MNVTIGKTEYAKDHKGTLRRIEAKRLTKRRRRILGMGRKTPNQMNGRYAGDK